MWTPFPSVWAFPSTLQKNLVFTISKPNFITYNTSLYIISNIKTSIFLTLHLNILFLSFFILPLSFFVSLSFVSLFHNPALPATISTHPYHNHHIHPPSPRPQTTEKKKKKKKKKNKKKKKKKRKKRKKKTLYIQSHKIKESQNHNKEIWLI